MRDEAIDSAEALCKVHGITRLATYDAQPLAIEVMVISSFGRRYLELMCRRQKQATSASLIRQVIVRHMSMSR